MFPAKLSLRPSSIVRGEFLSQIKELSLTQSIVGRDCLWQRSVSLNALRIGPDDIFVPSIPI